MLGELWDAFTAPFHAVADAVLAIIGRLGRASLMIILSWILAFLVSLVTLLLSVVVYSAFYRLYVPMTLHRLPVYFDYAKDLSAEGYPSPKPPSAVVNLLGKQWDDHAKRLNLSTMTANEIPYLLETDIEYDVKLDITVPMSPRNREIGSFMIKTDILTDRTQVKLFRSPVTMITTPDGDGYRQQEECLMGGGDPDTCASMTGSNGNDINGNTEPTSRRRIYVHKDVSSTVYETIASSARPVTLPHRGYLLHLMTTVLLCVPRFLGIFDEAWTIQKILIESYKENPYVRASKIRFVLSEKVIISEAFLHLKTRLTGLRYYMHHWYYTSAALGISLIFFVQNIAAIAFLYALWLQCGRPELPSYDEDMDYGARDGDEDDHDDLHDEDDGGVGGGVGGVGVMAEPGEDNRYRAFPDEEKEEEEDVDLLEFEEEGEDDVDGAGGTRSGPGRTLSPGNALDSKHGLE